ncbi:hypothetical protein AB0L40_24725 [Patulibacter sp. NPDC049589]|uniref:hypothetical protein n=1 Tax=Patulibacter sp. NPDC049589 TaxID=3154731 RepID=UPI00342916DD
MFGTTTWPTATTQPHAAPGRDTPAPGTVVRIRVSRRPVRSHRRRRDVRLPRIGHAGPYVVRVHRPAACVPAPVRSLRASLPHRDRVAR